MLKVVLCVPSLGVGGAEKFAVDLARSLDRKKYDVIVAETRIRVESIHRKTLEEHQIRIADLTGRSYIVMMKKQLAFLKRERPDVVHANTGSVLHVMVSCWLCKVPRRIYTVHNEAKLLYGKNKLKKLAYQMAFSFFRFVPVAICPTVKETLVQTLRLKAERIPVVKNGVDTDRFFVPQEKTCSDFFRVISVGSLYWIKNQEMMIRTISRLRKKGKRIRLTLLGEGEDRAKLEALVRELGVKDDVSMPGIQKDVERWLQESDLYISASKTEGLPLSILEAMACGLPVIATAAGGVKDIVRDGVCGRLVETDDESAFEQAILDLYENEALRQRASLASRRIAEAWSLRACAEGYSQMYKGK